MVESFIKEKRTIHHYDEPLSANEGAIMSEEEVVQQDNPLEADPSGETTSQQEGSDASSPSEKEDKEKGEPYLLNFKDKQTAERSFKEEQAKITKLAMQNAELKGRLDILEKMTEKKEESHSPEEQQARDKELIERLENGGSEAVLQIIREGLLDVVNLSKSEIAKLKSDIETLVDERDPSIQKNREKVDQLVKEYGMTRQNAVKFLKTHKLAEDMNDDGQDSGIRVERRAQIPGRTASGRATSDGTQRGAVLPASYEAYLSDSGLDEAMVKNIRKSLVSAMSNKENA